MYDRGSFFKNRIVVDIVRVLRHVHISIDKIHGDPIQIDLGI